MHFDESINLWLYSVSWGLANDPLRKLWCQSISRFARQLNNDCKSCSERLLRRGRKLKRQQGTTNHWLETSNQQCHALVRMSVDFNVKRRRRSAWPYPWWDSSSSCWSRKWRKGYGSLQQTDATVDRMTVRRCACRRTHWSTQSRMRQMSLIRPTWKPLLVARLS